MKNEEDPIRKRTIRIIIFILLTSINLFSLDSTNVTINVYEEKSNEPIPFCNISILKGSTVIKELATDFDGHASCLIPTGEYTIKATSVGYSPKILKERISEKNKTFKIELATGVILRDMVVKTSYSPVKNIKEVSVTDYAVPLIDHASPASTSTYDREEIRAMPTREVNSVVSVAAGVSGRSFGVVDERGSRSDATTYIVDGIKVKGKGSPAVSEKIITGGLPGTYSDKSEEIENNSDIEFADKLTAGEINDFSKWKLWENESKGLLQKMAEDFGIETGTRFCFSITDQNGRAVMNARVNLLSKGSVIYTAYTDNKGIAECWSQKSNTNYVSAEVMNSNVITKIEHVTEFTRGINPLRIKAECTTPDTLDLAFVVDATGSMSDEINYLKSEMLGLIKNIKTENNSLIIRIASVFYRDEYDAYKTDFSDFTTDADKALNFIRNHGADGGGDTPEMMEYGLQVAGNLSWSKNARAKIAILIADAPPHNNETSNKVLLSAIDASVKNGVRIVPIACSGTDKTTELLMRNFALLSNGTYLYLTDHSGVGAGHIDPTTDKLDHKKLNKLLLSVINRFTKVQRCEQVVPEITKDSVPNKNVSQEYIDQDIQQMISPENNNNETKITVSPNPSSGKVTVKSNEGITEIFLYNINGKVYKKFTSSSNLADLDLSEFATGEYILRVISNSKTSFVKLLIQR